jgi:hypothetical protein
MHRAAFRVCAFLGSTALAMINVACSGVGHAQEDTRESSTGLGYVQLQAPPPAEKRLVRLKDPRAGCSTVNATNGTWTGTSLATPQGKSRLFCSYAWSSRSGSAPDASVLDAIAMADSKYKKPYVVQDGRTSATASAPLETFGSGQPITFVATTLGGSGGTTSSGSFMIEGSGGAQSTGGTGLTIVPDTDPEGVPGCDVCGEPMGDWMFFVLPPDALYASTVMLYTDVAEYDLGAVSEPVFYTATPPTYSDWYWVSWW